MADHPNAAVFRAAMDEVNNDPTKFADYVADDVVWWQIGADEPVRGKAAFAETMSGDGGFTIEVDVHDIVASDDHVVALVEATARAGDQEFTYRTAEIYHVADGKITERWAFSDDTQAIMDFFAGLEG